MRDPYFQFLLLIPSLSPSLLCKCCINFVARKGVTLLCFGFHASIAHCRQESPQYSSNVDKRGNSKDPVSLGLRVLPQRCLGSVMQGWDQRQHPWCWIVARGSVLSVTDKRGWSQLTLPASAWVSLRHRPKSSARSVCLMPQNYALKHELKP